MRHCVVAGAPPVANVKVGVGLEVGPVGPPVIVTVGATVSIVKPRVALLALPAASVTRTSNVCAASSKEAAVYVAKQAPNAPVSMRHSVVVGAPAVVNVNV